MGRTALVAMNRRFYSSTRAALTSLNEQSGRRFIHIQDQQNMRTDPNSSYTTEVVDRWMFANSIHLIDLIRMFGRGAIQSVTPVMPWTGQETDVVLAKVEFASGDVAVYEGLWQGPGPWAASVSVRPFGGRCDRWKKRRSACGSRKREAAQLHPWDTDFKPGFRAQAEMAALAAVGQPSDSITVADAVESMRLVNDIFEFESGRTHDKAGAEGFRASGFICRSSRRRTCTIRAISAGCATWT